MAELARWIAREARRQTARPQVLEALLSGRAVAYARHRLGFVVARTSLRTGLHALEIGLLLAAFVPFDYLAPLLAYRAACTVLGAAHWGALETLRMRVREAAGRRQLGAARRHTERWLGLTVWVAGIAIAATLGIEVGSLWWLESVSLRDAFALACVVRLGLDSWGRVLHSGIFAVRRVHRPLWSTLAADVLELGVLALGFGALGVWSIPLGIVVGGACDAALGFLYVRRAYARRGLALPRLLASLGAAGELSRREVGHAAAYAFAGIALQLDAVVLLVLLQAESRSGGELATLYYVLRPLMAASTHGLRTFYFDLKLVETAGLRAFRPQLLRFLERLAVGWAALLGALTLALASALFEALPPSSLLALLPFFVARAGFALTQLVSFGTGELRRVLGSSSVALAGLGIAWAAGLGGTALLLAITVLLGAIVALERRAGRTRLDFTAGPGVLDLAAWLSWVGSQAHLRLAVVRVHARAVPAGKVLRALRTALTEARIARWGRRHVVVALPAEVSLTPASLIVGSGGALSHVWLSSPAAPNEALADARGAAALPDGWCEAWEPGRLPAGWGELARDFRATFPGGDVLELGSGRPLRTRAVNPAALHALVRCIRARSRGRRARSESSLPFELAVYAPCGQAEVLFVAAKGAPGFDVFRKRVQLASLHASWPQAFAGSDASGCPPKVRVHASGLR